MTAAGAPLQLLLVEDEPTQLLLTQRMLRRGGYAVETASDGATALAKLATGRFQFLVTDWEMPGMDGPTLCRRVRAAGLPGYLYILLLTGQIATHSVVTGLEAGADDYVRKPADEAELALLMAEQDLENTQFAYQKGGGALVAVTQSQRRLSETRQAYALAQGKRYADAVRLYVATAADWRKPAQTAAN